MNNLGTALQGLGARLHELADAARATHRLLAAVSVFRQRWKSEPRNSGPLEWALTLNNLGFTLQSLGERERGTPLLREAVRAKAGPKVRTREAARAQLTIAGRSRIVVIDVFEDAVVDVLEAPCPTWAWPTATKSETERRLGCPTGRARPRLLPFHDERPRARPQPVPPPPIVAQRAAGEARGWPGLERAARARPCALAARAVPWTAASRANRMIVQEATARRLARMDFAGRPHPGGLAMSFGHRLFVAGFCGAVAACGDYGGYKVSDRDNCVPCRERLPANQCPDENCCRYLSNDPYEASSAEAQARHDACVRKETGPVASDAHGAKLR